jgi:hypothetical protein
MPCSVAPFRRSRSVARAQRNGLPEVTVPDRCIPLLPAPYGTRVARSARTAMLAPEGDGCQLAQTVTLVLGDPPTRGQEPGGLGAAGSGDSNSTAPIFATRGQAAQGPATCGSYERLVPLLPAVVHRLLVRCGPSADRTRPGALADELLTVVNQTSVKTPQGRTHQTGSARPDAQHLPSARRARVVGDIQPILADGDAAWHGERPGGQGDLPLGPVAGHGKEPAIGGP